MKYILPNKIVKLGQWVYISVFSVFDIQFLSCFSKRHFSSDELNGRQRYIRILSKEGACTYYCEIFMRM